MRYAARSDENRAGIVSALRAIGCSVYDVREPVDLLVGLGGRTVLMEIKRPAGPRGGTSGREPTPAQRAFMATWRGASVAVVRSPEQAIAVMQADVIGRSANAKRHEPDGYYTANGDRVACTCKVSCLTPCIGACGCAACAQAYADFGLE